MITCTFIGHDEIFRKNLDTDIRAAIESVFQMDSEITFLFGGLSEFERSCSKAIRRMRHLYCHLDIRLILVLPYVYFSPNREHKYYRRFYDEVWHPCTKRNRIQGNAIDERNRFMIDRSDQIIACVYQDSGTAFDLLQYAKKQGKRIINFPDTGKRVFYQR